jgi:hypothetical protein
MFCVISFVLARFTICRSPLSIVTYRLMSTARQLNTRRARVGRRAGRKPLPGRGKVGARRPDGVFNSGRRLLIRFMEPTMCYLCFYLDSHLVCHLM